MERTLLTSTDIARLLDTPAHRVRHILNTRHAIRPIGRAGIAHVYDGNAVGQVQAELERIEARKHTDLAFELGDVLAVLRHRALRVMPPVPGPISRIRLGGLSRRTDCVIARANHGADGKTVPT